MPTDRCICTPCTRPQDPDAEGNCTMHGLIAYRDETAWAITNQDAGYELMMRECVCTLLAANVADAERMVA